MNKTRLQIITPDGLFYDDDVEIVTVRTTEGEMGLLHGKSPVVASLAISDLHIGPRSKQGHRPCAIAGGLVYVTPTSVRIITDAIEYKDQIDIKRAEEAKHRLEQDLKLKHDDAEELKLKIALAKQNNRINIYKGKF